MNFSKSSNNNYTNKCSNKSITSKSITSNSIYNTHNNIIDFNSIDFNSIDNNTFNSCQEVNIDYNICKSILFTNKNSEELIPPPLIKRLNIELENRDI